MKSVKSFNQHNEGFFSKKNKDSKLEKINDKISEASFSAKSYAASNQGSFVNGAKWAIVNLTDDEIDYFRKNGDKDDFSFFGG